jgi:gamma-glutamyltranspeptidase/glutathione hydrolase
MVVHVGDRPITAGDRVAIPSLADTLRRLADDPDDLYRGDLARRAAAASAAGEGILTAEDLSAYRPIDREPIAVPIDEWTVFTNPPPAVGGATMAAMVLLMGGHRSRAWDTEALHRYSEVQRAVIRYRRDRLERYGDQGEAAEALLAAARTGTADELLSAPSTVHTSAVDEDGTAIAITLSAGYGSGAMIPGTGFWMNNSLGEIELTAEGFHALPPGTRLISNMAPTIATREDGAVISLGSPGADRITTAIASVLLNHLHLGMPLQEAVDHPRMHAEVFAGQPTVAFEPGLPVVATGGMASRPFPEQSMYFGGVGAASWTPEQGVVAVADPRRAGGVAVVEQGRGGIRPQ